MSEAVLVTPSGQNVVTRQEGCEGRISDKGTGRGQ